MTHRIPDRPSIVGSLKAGATDFYFNSWRLVPANVIWGVAFVVLLFATAIWPPLIVLTPLLALPAAAIYRLSTMIVRGGPATLSDGLAAMRRFAAPALLVGGLLELLLIVFTTNIVIGIVVIGGISGGVFSVLAIYADLAVAMYAFAAWPIMLDPVREQAPLVYRLRLAFYVVAARAGRVLVVTLVITAFLIVSTILFAALLTISVAYVALVTSRYMLAAADRFEGRATVPLPDPT